MPHFANRWILSEVNIGVFFGIFSRGPNTEPQEVALDV